MTVLVKLALASASMLIGSSSGLISETRVPPGQHDVVVARTVGGMISYTRWPAERPALRLCISGGTVYTGAFGNIAQTAGRPVASRTLAPGATLQGCDIVYIGAMEVAARQEIIRTIRDKPILSIAESDPACRGGTIFCLQILADRVGFRLSIDAVSRSRVRVDPRVIRVAIPQGDGQ